MITNNGRFAERLWEMVAQDKLSKSLIRMGRVSRSAEPFENIKVRD